MIVILTQIQYELFSSTAAVGETIGSFTNSVEDGYDYVTVTNGANTNW